MSLKQPKVLEFHAILQHCKQKINIINVSFLILYLKRNHICAVIFSLIALQYHFRRSGLSSSNRTTSLSSISLETSSLGKSGLSAFAIVFQIVSMFISGLVIMNGLNSTCKSYQKKYDTSDVCWLFWEMYDDMPPYWTFLLKDITFWGAFTWTVIFALWMKTANGGFRRRTDSYDLL
ncbi:hypothetical protein HK096_007148, partial [Nowakowskiella sp. JEL0078]